MPDLMRVPRTAAATLEHTFAVGETGVNSTTPVTVAATDANGAAVFDDLATGTGQGRYTVAQPPQAALRLLTVAWSGTIAGAAVVETDLVEICGGFFFSLAEGRASDKALADDAKYTTADLIAARSQTEQECEEICDRAFVPRYGRRVLNGTGSTELLLPDHDIRLIRAVRVAPRLDEPFVALSAGELAALSVRVDQTLVRTDARVWTAGEDNVIVEYEFGLDQPPADLRRAAMRRFRWYLGIGRGTIPDRATSWTAPDGSIYRLDMPAAFKTGLPDVDGPYGRYSLRPTGDEDGGGRTVPVSRLLTYDPQHGSLFHGHRR
ncbi:MAG: hypothetical protein ACJ72N_06885 [Labedaea sp.]